jgi:ABC-2 type transport system ATP-binding protein
MRIELQGAKKRFGKLEALRGVDLTLETGARATLVGPNGSGKSTLIRALLGLIDCEGRVLLDGRSPYENRVELAKRIAYVPQVAPQLGASVREILDMVVLTRGLRAGAIEEVAARFQLELPTILSRPFKNLSGGMKQKLLLSVAFASQASFVVLDEPTASLDVRAREVFFSLFSSLGAQVTTLLCSHRLEELRSLSNTVIALEDGRATYQGSAAAYEPGPSPERASHRDQP